MMQLYSVGIAFLLGLIFTWLARYSARKLNFVNKPNAIVPQHVKPVAYLGGVGIFLGIFFTSITIELMGVGQVPHWFLGMSFLFLVLGVVDDLLEMKPLSKFLLQFIISCLSVWGGISFSFTEICSIDACLSVFWILVLVNALNLTDVCDGLVGGLSVIVFLWLWSFDSGENMIPAIAAGATVGFLVFNSPPASIFMGDAGSHLLGFVIAYLSMTNHSKMDFVFGFVPMALLSGVFLFELIFLIVIRKKKGLKWWLGSSDHFSLRLQAIGKSKWQTDIIAWGMGVFCGLPLLVVKFISESYLFLGLSICSMIVMLAYFGSYLVRKENEVKSS